MRVVAFLPSARPGGPDRDAGSRHIHSIGSARPQAEGVQYSREVRSMVIAFITAAVLLYLLSEWAVWQA
jgi:hypothetical protein